MKNTAKVKMPGVYVEEARAGSGPIVGVATSVTAFVGATAVGRSNKAVRVQSFADFNRSFGGLRPNVYLGYAVQQFFANGGSDAWVVRVAGNATAPQLAKGLRALDAVSLFNLLVLPGVSDSHVLSAAAAYCGTRRAFLIAESPAAATTAAQMAQMMSSGAIPKTDCGAMYFPWITVPDPLNSGQPLAIPPGGVVAGIFARTDATQGVWKAPAGAQSAIIGAVGLTYNVTDQENNALSQQAVNCLRAFPGTSPVVWGASTMVGDAQSASDWKYVPVRRLGLFLESSIRNGLQWVVFEPNAPPLWTQIRSAIAAFMQGLFLQGAFQGQKPQDAYLVKCDAQTTTRNDINLGQVNVVVGFAPVKPAEFILLSLQFKAAPPGP
jgi:phage tail sheath protein FI